MKRKMAPEKHGSDCLGMISSFFKAIVLLYNFPVSYMMFHRSPALICRHLSHFSCPSITLKRTLKTVQVLPFVGFLHMHTA